MNYRRLLIICFLPACLLSCTFSKHNGSTISDTTYSKLYGWWYAIGDTNSGFDILKGSIVLMYAQSDTIHHDTCRCIITEDSIYIFHPLRLVTLKYLLNDDTLSFKDSLDKVIEYCIRDKISAKSNLTDNTRNRFTIIQDSINVDAEIEDVDPAYHIYGVNLYISKGNDRYQIETVCEGCDTVDDVIDTLQSLIQWKGKYLLVPTSCGGGNAWRCETTHIFMILDNRLLKVGEGALDTIDKNGDGIFRDFYDKYETNDLTCHADAPGFVLYMYERNGALKVDLDETWNINQNEYQEYQKYLDTLVKQSNPKSFDNLAKLRPIVYISVLCRYCHKQDEIVHWNKVADIILDEDSKVKLNKILSFVVPGEMPWMR